jgi:protein LTV1
MGKKKPFIDKKNSTTYHVVRRSQRDMGAVDSETGETVSEFVLMPSEPLRHQQPSSIPEEGEARGGAVKMDDIKNRIVQAGLLADEETYDYNKHMQPITGSGVFFSGGGHLADASRDPRSKPLEEDIREVSRQLDSIALTPDCMDNDIAHALFDDFDSEEYEEILDDFCMTAASEVIAEDDGEPQAFDYDAHIASLIAKAQKYESGGVAADHEWGKNDNAFFNRARPLGEKDDDSDDEDDYYNDDLEIPDGVVSKLDPEAEKRLTEKFEQALAEYDSDEVGDLDDECEDIGGSIPLEGNARLEAAFDEYLQDKNDGIFIQGNRKPRVGGSGFSALVGTHMIHASQLGESPESFDDEEAKEEFEKEMEEAEEFLANPEVEPPVEDVLIDGKSYFSEATRNPWDCESILSTYSNLDNNPQTISRGSRRRKKKTSSASSVVSESVIPEESPYQIRLSDKTGLPVGVLPTRVHNKDAVFDDDTLVSVNKGEARNKEETKDEKKFRKIMVKQDRQVARLQKKIMKEAFREEFTQRADDVVANDIGGTTVFRYA